MKRCTCGYGAGRACPGQAALGEGWYCADARKEALEFANELPELFQGGAFIAVSKGAKVEGEALVLRADGAVVRFGREP